MVSHFAILLQKWAKLALQKLGGWMDGWMDESMDG